MIPRPLLPILTALFLLAHITPSSARDADDAWRAMAALAGTWRLAEPKTPAQDAFRISYRWISRNTALVESFGDPSKQITETIYHRDGTRLLATHYCAQGNQPRLRLQTPASDHVLKFEFLDVTNLKRPDDSHLIRITFDLSDPRLLTRQEVYAENDKESESTLTLVRAD
jgi:hypothetical protein